jgi:hypothetical protein
MAGEPFDEKQFDAARPFEPLTLPGALFPLRSETAGQ